MEQLDPLDLDPVACYRALKSRDARFDGQAVRRHHLDRHLLPADLPGPLGQVRELPVLPQRRRGAGSGLPTLPALPAGDGARSRFLARHLEHGLARPRADRGRRARRRSGQRRCAGRAARHRRAAAAAAVPAASRRLADHGGADPARAVRQAADPRHAAADGGGRPGGRLRQHPPLQRDLPATVPPPAERVAPQGGVAPCRRDRSARSASRCASAIGRRTIGMRCSPS